MGMSAVRRLTPQDHEELLEVYRDAVLTQAPALYSPEQVKAWSNLLHSRPEFRSELERGIGLVSLDAALRRIEAFALLHPVDRISLLYCRGRSSRQGRGSALLRALEPIARAEGATRLRTEASFLSRPLFEREGWRVDSLEDLALAGVGFRRFRMSKTLLG